MTYICVLNFLLWVLLLGIGHLLAMVVLVMLSLEDVRVVCGWWHKWGIHMSTSVSTTLAVQWSGKTIIENRSQLQQDKKICFQN
jgi:hypothetical protein